MEAKLKTLRVADLRELLQKASVPIPAKSNKADLIAKVLASPQAIRAFETTGSSAPAAKPKAPELSQSGQEDDLLAPPEEFDWGSASASASAANGAPAPSSSTTAATTTAKSGNIKAPASSSSAPGGNKTEPAPTASSDVANTDKDDAELERRKKRAARFGIPLVETKVTPSGVKASRPAKTAAEDVSKLEARAARFGVPADPAKTSGQKRARSPVPVDKDEMERRKKRAERFAANGESKVKA